MLCLIGLGLYDEKDMTLRGFETTKSCDKLYIELYTSGWFGLENLKARLDKEINEVSRKDLEENQEKILEEAMGKTVGILVPGDPLVATTHIDLLIQSRKKGIKTRIVHAPSIYSAIGETGLFIYKFGKTTTIPFPQERYEPESPYDTIKENRKRGLHTLCLLDIKEKMMTPKEGLDYLLRIEEKREEGVLKPEDKVVVFVLKERGLTVYDTVKNLMERNFSTPAVLIIPGKLHSIEKEALE